MQKKSLKHYIYDLTHLRRDNKYGGAPHKPILLLSIIENVESGNILDNKIFILPELVSVFKKLWSTLVTSNRHHCIFTLPFYHLRTESFWNLVANIGFENVIQSKIVMKSFSNLNLAVRYAEIDIELFNFMKSKKEREILKFALLDKYFPESKNNLLSNNNENYLTKIESEFLNESSAEYRLRLQSLKEQLIKEEFEEERFLRSNVFKRQVPIIYKNTCAISGLQINATINISLVDACHIVPFSNTFDDSIANGISLTPTLHRAFDRGLISIDENYKVLISNKFIESQSSQFSIKQFEGKQILLPDNKKYYPNIENLIWHRNNIFK